MDNMRDKLGRILPGNTLNAGGRGRPIENWRVYLRKNTRNGAEIHEIILDLARGKPRKVTLNDGRETLITPTAADSLRAAIHLDEMMHGKAVTQNEQQRAEREASALEAVRALSDSDLEARVAAVFERKALERTLTEGSPSIVAHKPNAEVWDEE